MKRLLFLALFAPLLLNAQSSGFNKAPWEMQIASSGSGIFVNLCNVFDNTVTGFNFIGNVSCSLIPGEEIPGAAKQYAFDLDPSAFLPSPSFKLSMNIEIFPGHQSCVRLFDVTANAPVPGSDVCRATAVTETSGHFHRAESAAFTLPNESRVYTVQGSDTLQDPSSNFPNTPGILFKVRLIATP